MKEVYDFLRSCGSFYIATVEDDQPRVRPFGVLNIFEDKLYVQTGKGKNVSKQIQKNPKVEICGCIGDKWIRVSGKLIRDDRREAKVSLIENNPFIKSMYSADDDNTEVLYFEDATATIYSFTEEPKVIKF